MSDDYIKRSDAIKTVCGDCEYYATNDCEDCRLHRLTKIPAADVKPVVYCRDCIHSQDGFICDSPFHGGMTFPEDFCSRGERREGGTP